MYNHIPTILNQIANKLIEHSNKCNYNGDASDIGNELSIIIGTIIPNMTKEQTEDLIKGMIHGVSLTNGTHSKSISTVSWLNMIVDNKNSRN